MIMTWIVCPNGCGKKRINGKIIYTKRDIKGIDPRFPREFKYCPICGSETIKRERGNHRHLKENELNELKLRLNSSLDVYVEEMFLSVRTSNALRRANINTVRDITAKTYEELSKIRNLGSQSLAELLYALNGLSLILKQNADDDIFAIIPQQKFVNLSDFIYQYLKAGSKSVKAIASMLNGGKNKQFFNIRGRISLWTSQNEIEEVLEKLRQEGKVKQINAGSGQFWRGSGNDRYEWTYAHWIAI